MRSGLEYVNIVSRATKNTANSEGIFDEKDARNDVSSRSSVESCIFKCVVHVSSHSKFTTHVTPNCVVDNRRGFPYGRTIVFFNCCLTPSIWLSRVSMGIFFDGCDNPNYGKTTIVPNPLIQIPRNSELSCIILGGEF